ncbi:desmoglein-2-like, partial [Clarias magur]
CVFEAGAKAEQSAVSLKRHRREWIVPPQILEENVDYTKQSFIARIRSDKEDASKGPIRYSLRGVGADQPPYHLFVVEPNTGNVRITGILDREQISQYNLSGVATYPDGTVAENDIQLRIKVKDQNDNAPIFSTISPGSTTVMKLVANDADEPGTPNSQIFYEIIDQKPPGSSMFSINQNGEVIVMNENLDRESVDQYVLTVRASDLNGAAGCNSGTSTCIIRVQDVNDNVPVLEQDSFEASVEENTENVEVMRFKATDMDMQNTDNWQAEYNIVSGNGGGHFKIVTDPKTNEGVLMLVKAVDYEEVKDMNLGITVNNKAPYYAGGAGGGSAGVGIGTGIGTGIGMGMGTGMGMGMGATGMTGGGSGGASGKIYNMHVNVKNQPEGPSFIPKVKAIPISENGQGVDIKKVLTTYTATDSDTGMPAKGVKYVKGSDRDNWLSIDETTGEIKLNKVPDRESPYLVNGTYMAEILCISQDMPGKTATGTVAIQVEDFNDHCPVLKNHTQTMCTTQEVLYVTAEDKDDFPNAGPFTFIVIPEESDGKWSVEHLNDTTAMLKPQDSPWPGPQKVTLEVRDQQGESCPEKQVLKLDVCTCDNSGTCAAIRSDLKSSVLGSAGIGLLLLGLLMLLLIPLLLLFCKCGTGALTLDDFSKMPFDTKEHLISYNTEGQGEDRDVNMMMTDTDGAGMNSTIHIPSKGSYIGTIGGAAFGAGGGAGYTISTINGRGYAPDVAYMDQGIGIGNRGSNAIMMDEFTTYDTGMALGEGFLNHYYTN